MNGEDRDTMLDFAGKIGSLTEAIDGLRTTTERIERKMDSDHEKWQENCRRLRNECAAIKEIPFIQKVLTSLTKRTEKLELNKTVQQLTWKTISKLVGSAVAITTALVGLLKALGIL